MIANEIATVRFLPAGGVAWTNAANLVEARGYAAVHAVSGGRVCVVGGLRDIDGATFSGNPATAIEVAPASLASFAVAATALAPRATPASAVVDGGQRVLSCGAAFDTPSQSIVPDTTAELFLP